jgi:glycine cleavage system H protein
MMIDGNEFPEDLYYHKDHMWLRVEGDKVKVGYNAWAADAAGKLVSIKTRPAGRSVKAGKTLGSIESGKWVGSLKVPVTGAIVEINPGLRDKPDLINDSPYGTGWVAIIEPSNLDAELAELIKGANREELKSWLDQEKLKVS